MARYVLVGGGVSTVTAAETLRQEEPGASIIILTAEAYPFYYRPMLPYFVAGVVPEKALFGRRSDLLANQGIEYRTSSHVVDVDLKNKLVKLENGEALPYDKLLLGTGAKPSPFEVAGAYASNLASLTEFADALKLKEQLHAEELAVVAGDSLSCVWIINALIRAGMHVRLLTPGPHLATQALDMRSAALIEAALRRAGVEITYDEVQRLMDSDRGLAGVLTKKGEKLDTQLVFPAVGFQPDTGPARKAGLEVETGIKVNEYLQTSDPDVFAAGDTIETDASGGLLPMGRGWLPAYEEGKIAAQNMLGGKTKYGGKCRRYSVRVFDLDVAILGDSKSMGPDYEERSELFEEAGVYKRLNIKKGVLVGAILIGNITEASKLETAIREGRRIKELSSSFLRQLFDGSYLLTENAGVVCPVCKYQMTLERPPEEGQVLTCPVCGAEFRMVRVAGRLVARSL